METVKNKFDLQPHLMMLLVALLLGGVHLYNVSRNILR